MKTKCSRDCRPPEVVRGVYAKGWERPSKIQSQALPYIVFLFAVPVNFWVHLTLLFFTAIWTTNSHDTLIGAPECGVWCGWVVVVGGRGT